MELSVLICFALSLIAGVSLWSGEFIAGTLLPVTHHGSHSHYTKIIDQSLSNISNLIFGN
ncbi:MAG: hypothetical protein EA411_02810 [Saprospirales bacterium]|nr:MAG: hypothetical protein EA411_02810 [Saprospirales bacterium]